MHVCSTTLEFLWNSPHGPEADATGYKGFYYHFLDMQTGRRVRDAELSTIDTALLLGGVLHVQQYFDQHDATEAKIRALADNLYRRVEWPWMQVRSARVCHGWTPETGFLPYDWGGYNEAMILYLLALGSPTFPISPGCLDSMDEFLCLADPLWPGVRRLSSPLWTSVLARLDRLSRHSGRLYA